MSPDIREALVVLGFDPDLVTKVYIEITRASQMSPPHGQEVIQWAKPIRNRREES